MEYVPLDITVISAEGLKNVNRLSKMDVYALVSISGDQTKIPVDKNCGSNPKWNYNIQFTLHQPSLNNHFLHFVLMCERTLGDKVIGDVSVPLRDLVHTRDQSTLDYQVHTASGKPSGTIKFAYNFGEKFTQQMNAIATSKNVDDSHVMAYPPPQGTGYSVPPDPDPHPQPYPQPSYYGGYPNVPPGYGYAPQPMGYVQQPKKQMGGNKHGMGLGAGLLGGLLVGDMVSDVGDMAAYNAGFQDGMDYDF